MSEFESPRNRTKAVVRRATRDGREVAIKDFGTRALWVRLLIGRPSLRREARAYARLSGVPGIPACLGFDGPDALVLTLAPGVSLSTLAPGAVPASVFDNLDRVISDVHARGVAIADLHRSNVLVDGTTVHVIDLAVARIARRADRPGPLVRTLERLDGHAAARLRAQFLGLAEPQPDGWFGALYRAVRGLKAAVRK